MGIYMLRRVVSSVERLNDKVGTLITDGSWFKEKFTQHEKAIHHLEQNAIDHERRISVCESKHEV